jgi:hypothetical protein
MSKEKEKLDQFHYHEALDRAYMVGGIVEEYLLGHPVVQKHRDVKRKVTKTLRLLAEVYLDIGMIDLENSSEIKDLKEE